MARTRQLIGLTGKVGPGLGMALALLPALAVHLAALSLTTATARPQAGSDGPRPPSAATLRFLVTSVVASVVAPAPAHPPTFAPDGLSAAPADRAVNAAEAAHAPAPAFAADEVATAAAAPSPALPPALPPAPASTPGVATAAGTGVPLDYLPRALLSVVPQTLARIDIAFPPEVHGSVNLGTELALFIDETGTVRHVRIDGGPLPPALEEAARSAFLSARFTPGELNGAPVRSLIRVAIRFDTEPLPLAATAATPAPPTNVH